MNFAFLKEWYTCHTSAKKRKIKFYLVDQNFKSLIFIYCQCKLIKNNTLDIIFKVIPQFIIRSLCKKSLQYN